MAETPTPTETTKRAHRLDRWIVRHYGVPENYTAVPEIAAALRAAESSALERAQKKMEGVARVWRPESGVSLHEIVVDVFRALIPPAAAPAAEHFQPASEQDSRSADAQVEGARSAGSPTPLRGTASGFSLPAAETGKAEGVDEIGYCKTCGLDASHGVRNDPRDARIAELERRVAAGLRLAKYRYRHWANSGGEEECVHGIDIGICCARCDMITLETGTERVAIVAPTEEPPAP